MLVLERRLDEELVIGDDIVVMVQEIRWDRVRLGITAPPEIPVHRQEVQAAIDAERKHKALRGPK